MRRISVVVLFFLLALLALLLLASSPDATATVEVYRDNDNPANANWIEPPTSLGPVRIWRTQQSTNDDWWKFNASAGQHVEIKFRKYTMYPELTELGDTYTYFMKWQLSGPYVSGRGVYSYSYTWPQNDRPTERHRRDTFSMVVPDNLGGPYFIRVYVDHPQNRDRTGHYFLNLTVSDVPSMDVQKSYEGVTGMHNTYSDQDPRYCVEFNFEDYYTINLDATRYSGDLVTVTLTKGTPARRVYVEAWSRIPFGNTQKDHMLNRSYLTGSPLSVQFTAPHPGTYYLRVYRSFWDTDNPQDMSYRLSLYEEERSLEGEDTAANATPVPKASDIRRQSVEMGYDTHDWYAAQIKTGDRKFEVTVSITDPDVDVGHGMELVVYNDEGVVMWDDINRAWMGDRYVWGTQLKVPPPGTTHYFEKNQTYYIRVSADAGISDGSVRGFVAGYNVDIVLSNRAPTLVSPFEDMYQWEEDKGVSIELDSHFEDVDGDDMEYTVFNKTPGFHVDANGLSYYGYLNITSPPDWYGEVWWRLRAVDEDGPEHHNIFIDLKLRVTPVADRPMSNGTITARCEEEGSTTVDLTNLFYDVDEGAWGVLTFGWFDSGITNVSVELNDITGEMELVPGPDQFGTYTFDVWCHDDVPEEVTGQVVLTVTPVNDAPRISWAIPPVEMDEGDAHDVEVDLADHFEDVDGDDLTYTFTAPSMYRDKVRVIHKNNILTESRLVITLEDMYFYGTVVVNITCTDVEDTIAQQDLVIQVSPVPNAPEILYKPQSDPSDIEETQSLPFELEDILDQDLPEAGLHNITWYLDGEIVLQETGSTSKYTYISDYGSEGPHTVKLEVVDPAGLTATEVPEWGFFVKDKNRNPTASITTQPVALEEAEKLVLQVEAGDPDGDDLTVSWYHVNNNDELLGTGTSLETTLPPGTQTIEVVVEDGKGGTASDTFVIKVNAVEEESNLFMILGVVIVLVIIVVVALAMMRMRSRPEATAPSTHMDLETLQKEYDPSKGREAGYEGDYDPTPQDWEDYDQLTR